MKKIFILICIMFTTIGCGVSNALEDDPVFDFMENIEESAFIDSYTIYGRFLNLEGYVNKEVDDLVLIFKNKEIENEVKLITNLKNGKTKFKTNEYINEGIDLEHVTDNYLLFLKSGETYYKLKKDTKQDDLEYYTVTRNQKNYQINIKFNKLDEDEYLSIETKEEKLPSNIYDLVIDPGHGGIDVGAINGKYHESDINLSYSLLLKEKLEEDGLKVKLTRESDVGIENYGKNGRVSIPYQTKAKLLLSIHQNSATLNVGSGGVEVYVPNHANLVFAKKLASNIVENTSTKFSSNVSNKVDKGVYLRTLTKSDLQTMEDDAKKDGYKPYERANTDSTYYYMIRETGGIITGAYVDGRNPKKEGNPYYNSNHGCESYLVELGYVSSNVNLNILLTEKEKYIEAIEKMVKEYLEI